MRKREVDKGTVRSGRQDGLLARRSVVRSSPLQSFATGSLSRTPQHPAFSPPTAPSFTFYSSRRTLHQKVLAP